MNNFFRLFDLYKKPITLPIQSQYKYSNITGFVISTITYIIFGLHLYFESYEVFAREQPNVLSNKNNIMFSKSTPLKLSNETLIFFLNIKTKNFKRIDLLNYFELESFYSTDNKNYKGQVELANCTIEDMENLSKYKNNYIEFEDEGIKICPRITFSIPANSIERFSWVFGLKECTDETKGCKRDKTLYRQLKRKDKEILSSIYFVKFYENLINFAHPFGSEYVPIEPYYDKTMLSIELKGSEIKTQSLFGFYETESRLKLSNFHYEYPFSTDYFFTYIISFNTKDITFHRRIYKTFITAFSNVYALFKLYSWIFSLILSNYYTCNVNNIIINKNFDYGSSIVNSNKALKQRSLISCVSEISPIEGVAVSNDYKVNKSKTVLTLSLIYRKVSCCRFLLCNRKNLTKRFFDKSQAIIYKQLSIEQLLLYLIEFSRFKNNLLDKSEVYNLGKEERLVLDLSCTGKKKSSVFDVLMTKNVFEANETKDRLLEG
jgi:hypothetical protein